MVDYGIIVAEDDDSIGSSKIKRLDSRKKQFKYKRIIDFKFPYPAVALNTQASKTLQFYFNEDKSSIGFVPAYEFYVQAYNGNWGIPVILSPQAYEGSIPEYPFYKQSEFITDKYLNLVLKINNLTAGGTLPIYDYPAFEATLRLVLLFDPLAAA